MGNSLLAQRMRRINHVFHFRQFAARPNLQLAPVWLHQPRCGFQTGDQRFTAAVKDNARTLATQANHPVSEGFRANAGRQAADAHHVELAQPAQGVIHKAFPVGRGHFKTGEVKIGHFTIFFRQLDVDTRPPLHHLEAVGNPQLAEQLLKTILVIFPQETANGDVNAEIFQHLRHVDTFPGGMQTGGPHKVDLPAFNFRCETHQVIRRV